MRFYKITEEGYILSIGHTDMETENEITEEEYNEIISVIRSKPVASETSDYKLKENLTWEEFSVDPPDPNPEINDEELLNILLGVAV